MTIFCLLDVYMTALGYLLGLSLLETVSAQFVFEHFSESQARSLDRDSRLLFPACFCLLLMCFWFLMDRVVVLLWVSHILIASLLVYTIIHQVYTIVFFQSLSLNRSVRLNKKYPPHTRNPRIRDLPWFVLSKRELSFIFCNIDSDGSGKLTKGEIETWVLEKLRPRLPSDQERAIRDFFEARFDAELSETDFAKAFNDVIQAIVSVSRSEAPVLPTKVEQMSTEVHESIIQQQ